jgi:hypothetical protein
VRTVALVSGAEKDQAKQIFTSSAASGILTNDLVKILQDEKVNSTNNLFSS